MKIDFNMQVGLKGHFTIRVAHGDGSVDEYKFDNLITDSGMDSIGNSAFAHTINKYSDANQQCAVGTGNTAPAFTDTALTAFLAGTVITNVASALTSTYGSNVYTYAFAQGAVVGNIAEVGTGTTGTGGNLGTMFNHALILDGGGHPTTIPVTAVDQLTVTYEVDVYWPTTDTLVNLTDSYTGAHYTVTCRAAQTTSANWWGGWGINVYSGNNQVFYTITGYTGALGPITGQPASQINSGASYTQGSYTTGTYTRSDTVTIPYTTWNGNLTAFMWTNALGAFQFGFSPYIPKTNTQTLTLTRSITWARYP
ncbi:MAG TPA: hypothetical protein VJ833_10100 [Rhodanobacteraceae bacterium]|nr:hypothetical protein [Rhodanobacteraceae bacterium]